MKYGFNRVNCCGCIEIKRGVKLLGILQGVQLALFVWFGFSIFTMWTEFNAFFPGFWILGHIIAIAPNVVGMWYYYYFLTSRDPTSRKQLPRAHLFNIITQCVYFASFTIYGLVWGATTDMTLADMWNNVPQDKMTPVDPIPFPLGGIQNFGNEILNWILNVVITLIIILLNLYWMTVTKRFASVW